MLGTNTLPMGGIAGLAATFGGATGFQKKTTPHFHGHVHLIDAYQYQTLADIAEAIEKAWLDPTTVTRFSEWIHVEVPPNVEQYEKDSDTVRAAWSQRYEDGTHDAM